MIVVLEIIVLAVFCWIWPPVTLLLIWALATICWGWVGFLVPPAVLAVGIAAHRAGLFETELQREYRESKERLANKGVDVSDL